MCWYKYLVLQPIMNILTNIGPIPVSQQYPTNILCAVSTQENSVQTYKDHHFWSIELSRLKRQEKYCRWWERNTVSVKEYTG